MAESKNVASDEEEKTAESEPFDTTRADEYEVASITRSRISKIRGGGHRTEFRVKWVGHDDSTWEPMDSLAEKCPLLFEEMEKTSRQNLIKSLGKGATVPKNFASFPQIPAKILSHFKDSSEFIPKGSEKVLNISNEICRNNEIFWLVSFISGPNLVYVRQCVMEYYFPTDSAYFHKVVLGKKGSMERALQKMKNK